MNATTYIYALSDPRTGQVRYVGKSDLPSRRLRAHVSRTDATHRGRWIASLLAGGLRPELRVLEEVARELWEDRERWWIRHFRVSGADLTNTTPGGEGIGAVTPETRARMSAAAKGRVAHNRGKSPSEETRARQREAAQRRWARLTDEQRVTAVARMHSGPQRWQPAGWKHTPEARAKIAAAASLPRPNRRTRARG